MRTQAEEAFETVSYGIISGFIAIVAMHIVRYIIEDTYKICSILYKIINSFMNDNGNIYPIIDNSHENISYNDDDGIYYDNDNKENYQKDDDEDDEDYNDDYNDDDDDYDTLMD